MEAEGDKRKAELVSEGEKIKMKNESEGTLIKVTNEAEARKIQLILEVPTLPFHLHLLLIKNIFKMISLMTTSIIVYTCCFEALKLMSSFLTSFP